MSLITRTAMLQARVSPEIKYASENVLRRIGLNLTEAMELFLRRMIVDQKIPFEVVALDNATFMRMVQDWQVQERNQILRLKKQDRTRGEHGQKLKRE